MAGIRLVREGTIEKGSDFGNAMTRRRWIAEEWDEATATITGAQAEHMVRVLRAQPGMEADVVAGGAKPKVAHRFYHVPASNTAVGHLILENAA